MLLPHIYNKCNEDHSSYSKGISKVLQEDHYSCHFFYYLTKYKLKRKYCNVDNSGEKYYSVYGYLRSLLNLIWALFSCIYDANVNRKIGTLRPTFVSPHLRSAEELSSLGTVGQARQVSRIAAAGGATLLASPLLPAFSSFPWVNRRLRGRGQICVLFLPFIPLHYLVIYQRLSCFC